MNVFSTPDILFEDTHLLAVNKPSGLLVHRGMGRDAITLVKIVCAYLQSDTAFPLHRLDRQTSGVVLFSKDAQTAASLGLLMNEGGFQKRYVALVRGTPADKGVIDHPIPKSEDGPRVSAVTNFRRLATADTTPRTTSLMEAFPQTGRFHQVRRHLKHIGHPIIGDANYGKGDINRAMAANYDLHRLALHAASLSFVHPHTGEKITITAPLPDDLRSPLEKMIFDVSSILRSPEADHWLQSVPVLKLEELFLYLVLTPPTANG